jgi:hypothetical protein
MRIPVAYFLVPCLPVAGRVYTADALHTHVALLELIWSLGGYMVLVVKDNQPTLLADLTTHFADPLAGSEQDSTTDFQHGRTEVRSIKVSTEMNSYLSTWPHITQVAERQPDRHRATYGQDLSTRSSTCSSCSPRIWPPPSAFWNWYEAIGALRIGSIMCVM